ncbi:hypothetical protein BH20CHL3_BH20CHL3_10830 [soil metagenome]
MTDQRNSTIQDTVTVSEHDTLPEVMNRIRAANGQGITLHIPEHSPIFLTASEFRTLRDIAEQSGVTLDLVTDDPLRLQLASMFGLAKFAPPAVADDDGHTDREVESTPSFSGWKTARARHSGRHAGADATEDPIAVSRRRRTELYEAGVAADRERSDGNVGLSEDASLVSLSYLDDDRGSTRARLVGRIVAFAVAIALIAGIAGWYYLPAVTVDATLRQGQIGTELLFSVTRPGADAPIDAAFSVEAQEISDTVEFDIVIDSTGRQVTPDEAASGTVTLRNASTEVVAIPAGTTLTTPMGVAYATDEDVEAPPGSADGSTIGEVNVTVTAVEPGSGGNLAPGELSGKISDLPIYFSNREAETSGGADIEVPIVTEEDIANVENQVAVDLRGAVAEDWTAQLPAGEVILTPSVEVGAPEFTIEQSVGDLSETVTLRGTVGATGLRYDGAEVNEQARANYESALAAEVPQGYEILLDTVALGERELVSQSPDSVEYTMSATARVRAIFPEADAERLADDLGGADAERAESILANVPAFESWSVSRSPGWWFERMPQTGSRVTIAVADTVAAPATPEAGTPASTPVASEDGS